MYGDDLPDCKLVPIAWDLPATVSLVVYTEGVSIPIVTGWFVSNDGSWRRLFAPRDHLVGIPFVRTKRHADYQWRCDYKLPPKWVMPEA